MQLCAKKAHQSTGGVVRVFLWEEVTAFHRMTLGLRRPDAPNSKWATLFGIESVQGPAFRPQMQHGALYQLVRFLIGAIML